MQAKAVTFKNWFWFIGFVILMACIALAIRWLFGDQLKWVELVWQWSFFTAITAVILALASKSVRHRNPNLFTALTLGSVLGKLIASLAFLFMYTRILKPEGRAFIILFFLLYVGYTIYEIRTLTIMVGRAAERKE